MITRERIGDAGWAAWWFVRPAVIIVLVIAVLWGAKLVGLTTGAAVAILLLWVLPVFVGYRLYLSKDRDAPIALAILFGWIGVLFALALAPAGRRCPRCDETIRKNASVCRFCGADTDAFPSV